jgi:putative acetyltransferase
MVEIHPEKSGDISQIRHVNDEAFGGIKESRLVDDLRDQGMLTVSLVAVLNGEVLGHIAFSPVTIESKISKAEAITLAPLAVLPKYQRQGIGSQLVNAGIDRCRSTGHDIIFVVGHPEYYPRFGFTQAKRKGFDCEFPAPDEAWMVLELYEGALKGISGTVKFQPEFRKALRLPDSKDI